MKTSPAPWRIDQYPVKNGNGQKDYTIIRIVDADGRLVTEMTDLSRTEQNMANAELIAKVPRLEQELEHAKKTINYLEERLDIYRRMPR